MQLMGTVSNRLLNAAPGWIQYVWIIQRWKLTFWNFSFESLGCGILFVSKQWLSCLLWQGLEQGLVAIRSKQAETAEAGECLLGLWLFKNCKLMGPEGQAVGRAELGQAAGERQTGDTFCLPRRLKQTEEQGRILLLVLPFPLCCSGWMGDLCFDWRPDCNQGSLL